MKKWKEVELQDIALQQKGSIVSGPFGSNIGSRFFVEEGIPVIRGNNLSLGKEKFKDDGFVYLTEEKAKEFRNCEAIKDDIIFTAAGTIGQVGIIPQNTKFPKYIISNKQLRIRIDTEIASPIFAYYWLSSDKMIEYIKNRNNGGAVPLINLSIIRKIPFPLPPLPTQQRIAAILSSYDDLIENNRRRITLLEDSARLLYKEWFVKFKFPGHEKVKVKNGLPEEWGRKKIGEVGNVITGKTPSTQDSSNYGGDILFIKTPDFHSGIFVIDTETKLTEKGASTQQNKFVPANTILTACIGNGLGVVSMTSKKSQFNQQINGFISHDSQYLYYFYITFCGLKSKLESIGASATMPNVNKSVFEGIEINIPSQSIAYNFHELATPIFKQILTLQHQTQKLREARNILLPKLMNGTIEV
jgi:type I restriction enzyme S subunit